MTLDRRLVREIAPFGAATVLGFAVVPIGNRVAWAGYALASALVLAIACVAVVVPRRRLPGALRVIPRSSSSSPWGCCATPARTP
jgi:hypothetical protein